ncbi:MAG: RNA polymerase sigma factor [bacterium]|nr:MAG: RNA polymerase sigma factor [bacterium]
MEEIRDETLALKAASGDMMAFEELVNRHRMTVYRMARTVTGNHHDADDAAQETFLRVYRSLRSYDPQRPFRPWLRRIAYNTSLNNVRARSARSRGMTDTDPPDVPDPNPGQSAVLEARQSAVRVEDAVDSLPGELRATLLLRVVEGMSYKEIAAATGVRIGTVMSRLSRARERVQECLQSAGKRGRRGDKA